jgi:tetratricopeptide (TPR) repeat protein
MSSRFERASILIDWRRYDLAAAELLAGLAQDRSGVWAYCALAVCRSHQGRHDEAHWLARRAIELGPSDPDGYVRLAWTILRNPNCRPTEPLSWRFSLRRAWSYLRSPRPVSRRLEEVERLTREALRLDPRELRAHGMLAGTLLAQARPGAALEAAEHGLAVDPNHEHCRNLRTRALMELGRTIETSEAARATLEIHPESSDAHTLRGRVLLLEGKCAEAAEHFRQSLRINPDDAQTRNELRAATKTTPAV